MDEQYLQQDDREDTELARMEREQWLSNANDQEEYQRYLGGNKPHRVTCADLFCGVLISTKGGSK